MLSYVILSILFCSAFGLVELSQDDLRKEFETAMAEAGINEKMLEAELTKIIANALSSIPEWIEYKDVNMTSLNDTFHFNGNIRNVSTKGFDPTSYDLTNLKFGILPMGFSMRLFFRNVNSTGLYDISGIFGHILPLYGDGSFDMGATGVDFYLKIDLSSYSGHLIVTNIVLEFSLETLRLRITNFLGGDLGDVICQMIEENAVEYVKRFFYWYGPQVIEVLKKGINVYLSDKTIQDLIDIIKGNTTLKPSTTPASFLFN